MTIIEAAGLFGGPRQSVLVEMQLVDVAGDDGEALEGGQDARCIVAFAQEQGVRPRRGTVTAADVVQDADEVAFGVGEV